MAKKKVDNAQPGALYEVLVDHLGIEPPRVKGDLLTAEDLAECDTDWLLAMGSVRLAPEYAGSGLASTTRPVESAGGPDASGVFSTTAAGTPAPGQSLEQAGIDPAQATLEGAAAAAAEPAPPQG